MRDDGSNLDFALHKLHRAQVLLDAMAMSIPLLVFQPRLRKTLMAFKDEIKAALADAATKVRAEKDVEKALRADSESKQAQIAAMQTRIDELMAQPGAWTDADVQEIRDGLTALNAAFDPDATVANVLTNTDNPPA